MGLRGPRPKPARLLELTGGSSKAKRRAASTVNPDKASNAPPCPAWLSEAGRDYWDEIASELVEWGLLTRLDTLALGLLVDALGSYAEAKALSCKAGLTAMTAQGVGEHPTSRIARAAWGDLLRICREFGLTPSSRCGLHVAPPARSTLMPARVRDKSRFFDRPSVGEMIDEALDHTE